MPTVQEIKEMAEIFSQVQLKHNPAAGAGTYVSPHGGTGMFVEPGVRPEMYSTLVRPKTFMNAVPFEKSTLTNELISILTGQLAVTGTNPDTACGTPPKPGQLKKCTRTSIFGRTFLGTEKLVVPDIGRQKNRADVERIIRNTAPADNPMLPELLRMPGVNFLSAKAHQLFMLSVQLERTVAPQLITGNNTLAAAATEIGAISEFDGLDRLVKTGHVDISASIVCPAADSHIITWGKSIDGTTEGLNIVQTLGDIYLSRIFLADDVGIGGVQWSLVMDKRLFIALTRIVGCTFENTRCTDFTAGAPGTRNQAEIEARTLEMQGGQFIWLHGDRVPVLFTAGSEIAIPSKSANGLTGDIFLVPMRWSGGNLLWMDYFPMDNQYIAEWNAMTDPGKRVSHNNGMYMTAPRSDGFCDELLIVGDFRLRLDTPFLAARLDNIVFSSYKGYRSFDPGRTFFYDGGTTQYTG